MSSRYMGVQRPDYGANEKCWVLLRNHTGALWADSQQCGCKARPGMLTCRHHAQHEDTARHERDATKPSVLREKIAKMKARMEQWEAKPNIRTSKDGPTDRDRMLSTMADMLRRLEATLKTSERQAQFDKPLNPIGG